MAIDLYNNDDNIGTNTITVVVSTENQNIYSSIVENIPVTESLVTNIGIDGFNPKIELVKENDAEYILSIQDYYNTIITPNLKASGMKFANSYEFPNIGASGVLYIATDQNEIWIWQDNKYIVIGSDYNHINIICGGNANG